MAFLPVAVPGGQGKRTVFVDPEEVIAVLPSADNTYTSIVFRHQEYIVQVQAPFEAVLAALQCGPRVEGCKHLKPVVKGRV